MQIPARHIINDMCLIRQLPFGRETAERAPRTHPTESGPLRRFAENSGHDLPFGREGNWGYLAWTGGGKEEEVGWWDWRWTCIYVA